ncbi:lysozyme inhibitor LprI family protein [Roseovarius aestuariivivens]|uniref:lysozyme inhibitor LprI family protein n=1 Tax=Roseovarius aestuariivivens TaxID=1888910 RepID=UPI001AEC426D|nr:lysozyme inhibitor LprI family protein [Roseovarius aestuariivivens]
MRAAAILAVMLASPVAAQDCDGTTAEMIDCGARSLDLADGELNAVYKRVMHEAQAGGYAEEVRAAQRLWIPYRDAACAAEAAPYDGGSSQPLIRISCLTRMTEARTEELRMFSMN